MKRIIIEGNCREKLNKIEDNSVDLIITSPPYADQRKKTYGGIHPDKYVKWFLPISKELYRVLNPQGSFVLNIKEKVVNGERHTYVLELILEMKKQGWLWTEEYIWHKKTAMPGKWPNRFRDAWERCLHFTKNKKFKMNQDAVKVPIGNWAESRMKKLSENDKIRTESATKSGMGRKIENWSGKEMVYPTNVLHSAGECGNKNHSAVFPTAIPDWFVRLFTDKGDTILDPFMGSGTSGVSATKHQRDFIGIEIHKEYCEIAKKRIEDEIGETNLKKPAKPTL